MENVGKSCTLCVSLIRYPFGYEPHSSLVLMVFTSYILQKHATKNHCQCIKKCPNEGVSGTDLSILDHLNQYQNFITYVSIYCPG